MDTLAQAASGWQQAYEIARGVFIFLDAVLLGVFIFSFLRAVPFRPRIHPEHGKPKKIYTLEDAALRAQWEEVTRKVRSGSGDALKLAVVEADKVVDDALKQLGFEGDHMADRLEDLSEGEVHTLPRVWRAHRLRNNLVHTPGFQVSPSEAKGAIADYEAFLKEIKLLQ